MRVGVIDVGSNAIRLSVAEHTPGKPISMIKSFRAPLRLGSDSFSTGVISNEKILQLIQVFHQFHKILVKNGVDLYKAVATSALREAKNCNAVISRVFEQTKLRLDVIDGIEESRLVQLAVNSAMNIQRKNSLILDIGGGSLEIIISKRGKLVAAKSLKVGTVRLLEKFKHKKNFRVAVTQSIQNEIKKLGPYIKHFKENKIIIGTGGNVRTINRVCSRLFKNSKKNSVSYEELEALADLLFNLTLDERQRKLNLRPDRADVILPATILLLEVMRVFKFKNLAVPPVGLKEGLTIDLIQ